MKNLIWKIKKFMHLHQTIEEVVKFYIERTEKKVDKLQLYHMKQSAINCTERGVTDTKISDHEVIVSLTSYSKRIHEVYLAIESIMQGTIKPNRIILWLTEEEFKGKKLPIILQKQIERGLEVMYCPDLRAYKKIIPTLKLYPDSIIVTIDDDLIYEPDLLEHLLTSYQEHPECVSACRTELIKTDRDGKPLGYMQWGLKEHVDYPSHFNFLTGGGGTLFPPHCLHKEAIKENIFMTLCPKSDDVWLNAMLLLNGVKVCKAFTHDAHGEDFYYNVSPHVGTLWAENQRPDGNDVQLKAVWEKYDLYKLLK